MMSQREQERLGDLGEVLQERATRERQRELYREEQQQRTAERHLAPHLVELLQELDVHLHLGENNVALGDLRFRAVERPQGEYQLQLMGTCPECGNEAWSSPFTGFRRLGDLLVEFEPDPKHTAEHRRPGEGSATEELYAAVQRVVRETQQG